MEDRCRFYRVSGKDLVYLKFILEAYEGLSTMSTVDPRQGIVKVVYPVAFADDVESLMQALAKEITVTEVTQGGDGCWNG
ncbi:DUF4911 domain-containing protein [Geomesophilobacter sediminis]|uniref:DUF4911 domain-containing protein n=1 Tax=Geomesophilobacter sediminis TaxID=2798584 RepID=A0A8J7JJU6_9BACT|nr:DUF4911 domain-containing protein [Geomesophilobacter sediminis]MBJ6723275.1 DUF4911 domain-containing protein [Geomesophilobacter sediminis]